MTYIFIVGAIICLGLFFFLLRKESRNLLNGVVLVIGLFLGYCSLFTIGHSGDALFETGRVLLYVNYIFFFIIGIALLVNFFLVTKKEGISITNLLPLGFGVLSIIVSYSGYVEVISGISGSEYYVIIMSILYNIATYLPFAFGTVLLYALIYEFLPKRKDYNYIVVLGCRISNSGEVTPLLRGRIDKAILYYNKNNNCKIVVSGGQGSDEVISEAKAMKNYLLTKNIPSNKIILEDKSTNTRENLLFSYKKTESNPRVLICTNNYHVLRTAILSKELGIDAQVVGGRTALYYLPAAFFRECIALVFKYKYLMIIYILVAILFAF